MLSPKKLVRHFKLERRKVHSMLLTSPYGNLKKWLIKICNLSFFVSLFSLVFYGIIWEYAKVLGIPLLENLPSISSVLSVTKEFIFSSVYLEACTLSIRRILIGFVVAQILAVPLGLLMAMHRTSFNMIFPIVEMLRPIPPVAWIPVAIIFWPTRELSVISIIVLGGFWVVLLNTLGGASNIDLALKRAAISLGSKPRHIFWKIVLPAALPSIITGMVVGIGISWEMVVAAEMISGNGGLGYLLWQSFEFNAIDHVIVCMISIGIAGYASSAFIRVLGQWLTPWRR